MRYAVKVDGKTVKKFDKISDAIRRHRKEVEAYPAETTREAEMYVELVDTETGQSS